MSNLAAIFEVVGKHAQAEVFCKRALAIQEMVLGSDHPAVANSLHNPGFLHLSQGQHTLAEPLLKQALAIAEKALGPWGPHVRIVLDVLLELYRKTGRTDDAKPIEAGIRQFREMGW